MAKKKKAQDIQQTSLFSFVEKPKSEKNASKKAPKKKRDAPIKKNAPIKPLETDSIPDIEKEIEEKEEEDSFDEKEEIEPLDEDIEALGEPMIPSGGDIEVDIHKINILHPIDKKEIIPIPKDKFFRKNNDPFGLKEKNIKLEPIKRETVSSKYIRYIIETGDVVQDLERGLLLDVDYDGVQNKAYCKFYDLDNHEIKIWIDTTNHEPYCLSKETKAQLESSIELTNYQGFKRLEEVKKFDLLRDKEIPMIKLYGNSPTDIGGSGTNIRNILGKAWEADIRYHLNYIYDRGLIPGLIYTIKKGKLEKIEYSEDKKESDKLAEEIIKIFEAEEHDEIKEFAKKNLEIFLTPIPDVKRMAIDIEVSVGENDFRVPDPQQAGQEIISISFVATDGLQRVYMLEREGFSYGKPYEKFPAEAELLFFKTEKELLIETFRLMWEYPMIITFNGDNFDLNYMYHRANSLRIEKDLNPIQVKRGFGFLSKAECELRKGIHIDIFNFFFNRSISGYAFGGAYGSSSLNAISSALLGQEKYKHEEEIHEMEYNILAWYNLKDSILTLELTRFNNNLVWNLIVLLCRMTKMPLHDMIRHQISAWIQNIFYFEHRTNNYLIPRRSEISEVKKGGYSKSSIEGKGFQGAYVVDPVPGIHYDVVVMDFASLYPSIIKEYNLSYETVQCPHENCKDNLIKGIPYYVCTHKMGIFAYVVGFFRDIRVKFFKPKSGDKSLSPENRSYFNTIQQALKVFINGSYGVFGSQNFPLFCLPVAESTTGIGRYSIKATINKSENMGIKVLYGDSDSVFLLNPNKEELKAISDWSREELDLDLEEEKTYQFLALSERKKNYIGIYKGSKAIDIKGLVAKKRNTPNFIKKIFGDVTQILKNITNNEDFEKAKKHIIEIIRDNRKKIGRPDTFSLDDYVINIGIQKKLGGYEKVMPQHIKAALDLKKVTGREYQKGEVISIIKTKGGGGAKAVELATLNEIDVKKYQELLKSALEQVLDALGISYDEIKGIRKMDSFF